MVVRRINELNRNRAYNIFYGLDEQRIKTVYDDFSISGHIKTRYYFGTYEKDIDEFGNITETDYLYTPVGLTAMQRKTSAGANLYYIHTDLLGSIQAISNASGVLQAEYAYTPWGGRITLTTPPAGDLGGFDRGYTGHEHLSPFGDDSNGGFCLINMNGRIYDPVLARFLSPDPYVQAPDFTQSFNRYAYCWNNPFRYTDPSGELIYVIPGVNWSRSGGLSISLSAGFGLPGAANIGITLGYGFSNNNFSATINGSLGGGYLYAGYDTKGGFIAGAGFGSGNPALGVFSTNMMNVGINYSSNGGWSGNYLGVNISKNGASFDPSFGASMNFKWGTGETVYSINNETDMTPVSKSESCFVNTDVMNQKLSQFKETLSPYKIIEIGYENTEFKKGTGLIRLDDGRLYHPENDSYPSGAMTPIYRGLKTNYHIYMSPHKTINAFKITFNHELIHIYHHQKYGKTGTDSEYVATAYSQFYDNSMINNYLPGNIPLFDIPSNLLPISISQIKTHAHQLTISRKR